jgi:hypothetical protein
MATRPAWPSTPWLAPGRAPSAMSWPKPSAGSGPTSRRTAPGRAAR